MNNVLPNDYKEYPHETFSEPSMCDKTAFEPLELTMQRMMASGRVAGNARRAMYDYNNENVDMDKAQTMPIYGADLVDMKILHDEAVANAQKIVVDAKKTSEDVNE